MKINIELIKDKGVMPDCGYILMQAYNGEPWNDTWTHEKAIEKVMYSYNSPNFIGWVVKVDNKVVGGCVGNIEPNFYGDFYYLREMFLLPEFQSKGIGSQLIAAIQNHLKSIAIKEIVLLTNSENHPHDFYIKNGLKDMPGMTMMYYRQV